MNDELKLCKDCKHYRRSLIAPAEFSRCAVGLERVTGKAQTFCDLERKYPPDMGIGCGIEGLKWERRQTKGWAFWKA